MKFQEETARALPTLIEGKFHAKAAGGDSDIVDIEIGFHFKDNTVCEPLFDTKESDRVL